MAIISKKKFSGALVRMARLNKELAEELRDVLAYLHWSELNGNADPMKEFKASAVPAWIRDLGAAVAAKPNDNLSREEKINAAEELAADVVIKAFMSQQEKRDAAKAKREAKKAEAEAERKRLAEIDAAAQAAREAEAAYVAERDGEETPELEGDLLPAPKADAPKADKPKQPAPEEFILGHYGGKDNNDSEMILTREEYAAALKAINALRGKASKPKAA